ncbi:MAG TPA: class I SAM-dependent methyltransferase [Lentimicrobium sp.]|nr:class I SAM-dependent methyltransferase [Lentimicrobium sp.]
MDDLFENIDKQIVFNQGKNIFNENLDAFQFSEEIVKAVSDIARLDPDTKQILIDYATDRAIAEFCRVNQYYSFDLKARAELKNIYTDLFESLCTLKIPVNELSKKHYDRLRDWIKNSNPFAVKIYSGVNKNMPPVTCSEYSPDLQIDLLKIDIGQLMQPVLDVGCGSKGNLVKFLANLGIETYGIDRCKFPAGNLVTTDWLIYKYGNDKWGTIVSNLGFSNHFQHHHLREDGKFIEYARTFMNILNSLKVGGSFHYAPDLEFIEKYLDNKQFSVQKHSITGYEFQATVITRLK